MRKLNLKTIATVRESYNSKGEEIIETGRHKACPYNQNANINNNIDSNNNATHCRGTVHRARIENSDNLKFISNLKNVRKPVEAGIDSARGCRGITLIALIITIIVLVILAGVALNFVLGENGILKQAEFAKNKYQNASEQEQADLEAIFGYLENQTLPDNTPTTDAGTPVKIPNQWQTETPNYTRTTDGKIITSSTKIATVTAISDGTGNTIPVPAGFYYVGGTIDSGVVISDDPADQNKYAGVEDVPAGISLNADGTIKYELVGNQFVWIPVTNIDNYKTYEWTSYRDNYSYTYTSSYEKVIVKKYGGFYVGRFEAGLASTITELTSTTQNTGSTQTTYNSNAIPQSKPGLVPWMFIDYTHAKTNAESLYADKASVESGLLSGTMWDTMIIWQAGSSTSTELTNSTKGNCANNAPKINIGKTAYAYVSSGYWYLEQFAKTWSQSTQTDIVTKPSFSSTELKGYLLTTGASEECKLKNIYDVAGNVWECIDEKAYKTTSGTDLTSSEHRVIRGGDYLDASSTHSVCYRGYTGVDSTNLHVGFRVALYMK